MTGRLKGATCLVLSAFGFALMALFVRLCDDYGESISCFQKSFFRNVIAFFIALAVFMRTKRGNQPTGDRHQATYDMRQLADDRYQATVDVQQLADDKHQATVDVQQLAGDKHQATVDVQQATLKDPKRPYLTLSLLLLRAIFGTVGIFANFYALSRIPIGEAMTLNRTAPFFTVFASWLLLGECVTRRQLTCLVLAFSGALLVMKPLFGAGHSFATIAALVGGLGAGLAYVCVHQLGRMKVNGALIVLFFSAFSCVASLPFAWATYRTMTLAQIAILLGAGAGAALGQFGVTAAYRFAEPRSIAAVDYTNVIFTALFGFMFFGQVPDVLSIIGFIVIVIAALGV